MRKQLFPFQVVKSNIIGAFAGPAYAGKMEVHVGPQDTENGGKDGTGFMVYPVHSTPGGKLELPTDTISDYYRGCVSNGELARFQGKWWRLCHTYQCNNTQCIVMELATPPRPERVEMLYAKYERQLRHAKSQAKRRWCLAKMRKYRDTTH